MIKIFLWNNFVKKLCLSSWKIHGQNRTTNARKSVDRSTMKRCRCMIQSESNTVWHERMGCGIIYTCFWCITRDFEWFDERWSLSLRFDKGFTKEDGNRALEWSFLSLKTIFLFGFHVKNFKLISKYFLNMSS